MSALVDQISVLTLLEASELVDALKTRLNIVDIPLASLAPSSPSSAPVDEAAPAEEKPKEKTIFVVKLTKIDTTQKAKVIKEVKALRPDMNLMQAKTFVESLPQTLKEGATKEEADKLIKALEAAGATVTME